MRSDVDGFCSGSHLHHPSWIRFFLLFHQSLSSSIYNFTDATARNIYSECVKYFFFHLLEINCARKTMGRYYVEIRKCLYFYFHRLPHKETSNYRFIRTKTMAMKANQTLNSIKQPTAAVAAAAARESKKIIIRELHLHR